MTPAPRAPGALSSLQERHQPPTSLPPPLTQGLCSHTPARLLLAKPELPYVLRAGMFAPDNAHGGRRRGVSPSGLWLGLGLWLGVHT